MKSSLTEFAYDRNEDKRVLVRDSLPLADDHPYVRMYISRRRKVRSKYTVTIKRWYLNIREKHNDESIMSRWFYRMTIVDGSLRK